MFGMNVQLPQTRTVSFGDEHTLPRMGYGVFVDGTSAFPCLD